MTSFSANQYKTFIFPHVKICTHLTENTKSVPKNDYVQSLMTKTSQVHFYVYIFLQIVFVTHIMIGCGYHCLLPVYSSPCDQEDVPIMLSSVKEKVDC